MHHIRRRRRRDVVLLRKLCAVLFFFFLQSRTLSYPITSLSGPTWASEILRFCDLRSESRTVTQQLSIMQEAPSHKAKAFCSAPETCFPCCCTWCIYQVLTYFEAERSAGLAKLSSTAAVLFPCTTVSTLYLVFAENNAAHYHRTLAAEI